MRNRRKDVRENLRAGYMEEILVDLEIEDNGPPVSYTHLIRIWLSQ